MTLVTCDNCDVASFDQELRCPYCCQPKHGVTKEYGRNVFGRPLQSNKWNGGSTAFKRRKNQRKVADDI